MKMNKKQYNNVIDWTLRHEQAAQTEDSLTTARVIFKNLGIALPNGSMQEVYDTIKTNAYMGWRVCTMQEAQEAANKGTAAIGISNDRIVILSAIDEEQPVTQTASVMTISEKTSAHSAGETLFYSHTEVRSTGDQYGRTDWPSIDAAKKYYGMDWVYTPCDGYYNWYYTFSDGSRMYFRVV